MVEQIAALPASTPPMDVAALSELLSRRAALYDKDREEHYNLISALHKIAAGFGSGCGAVIGSPGC